MNLHDAEVAARIRERCKVGIAGPSVRTYRKLPTKYKGPIHRIRPDNVKNTNEQRDSLFLTRLPCDVRVIIYTLILRPMCNSKMIHFTRGYRGLSQCNLIRSESCHNRHSTHAWSGFEEHCPTLATLSDNSFLDLWLTCRLIHFETTHVLYSRTPFHLFDLTGLQTLITRTPSYHLNTITSLSLTWFVFPPLYLQCPRAKSFYGKRYDSTPTEQAWSNLCLRLAAMPRLTTLHITIHNLELTGLQLLQPLIEAFCTNEDEKAGSGEDQAKRKSKTLIPSDFVVSLYYSGVLPWSGEMGSEDLPFRIRRLLFNEWQSAPGAKVWPPPSYREPTVWDRFAGRMEGLCGVVGAGMVGVWRGVGDLGRGRWR